MANEWPGAGAVSAMVIARDLMLDFFRVGSGGLDPLDLTLVLAVMQANVAQIASQPDLQVRYGGRDGLPPDELRRPIAVNALAQSIGAPFETVRRRMRRLAARGVCEILPAGVIVPQRTLASAQSDPAMAAIVGLLRDAYRRLRVTGFLGAPGAGTLGGSVDPQELPRVAARLASGYFLRMTEPLIGLAGSIPDTFILMQILRENTRQADDVRAQEGGPTVQLVPDAAKTPVALTTVAVALRMSHETVRRRVKRFVADGRCACAPGGYIIPQSGMLMRPQLVEAMASNQTHLTRLYRGLESWGFLAAWEAEAAVIAA